MIGAGDLAAKVVMGQQEGEEGLPIPADDEEEGQEGVEETSDVGEGIQDGIEWNVINVLLYFNCENEPIVRVAWYFWYLCIVEAIELEALSGLFLGLKGKDRAIFVDGTFFELKLIDVKNVLSSKWSLY